MAKLIKRITMTKKMQMVFIDEICVNLPNCDYDIQYVKVDCKRRNNL